VLWGGKYEYAGKGATKKAMRRRWRVSVAVKERTTTDICRRRRVVGVAPTRRQRHYDRRRNGVSRDPPAVNACLYKYGPCAHSRATGRGLLQRRTERGMKNGGVHACAGCVWEI